MNKEDILKKSREENKNGDEREEKIKLNSYAMSAAIGGLLCMVFVLLETLLFGRITAHLWVIYSGILFSKSLLDAVKLKKRRDIVCAVLWGIVCVLNIAVYILDCVG